MQRVLSLGYDLGDGETIIDAATFDYDPNNPQIFSKPVHCDLRMPDTPKTAEAIPTGYGYQDNEIVFGNSIISRPQGITNIHAYFKRKPKDLLGAVNAKRYDELRKIFSSGEWPSQYVCPEVYTAEFIEFKNSVQTFTNAIFSDNNLKDSIRLNLLNRDEIIICVGHPTKWDELDALIYKTILNGSILGENTYLDKPCYFILAKESRAAYLCLKDKGTVQNTPAGTCSLLINIGSSTIDVTAVTQDSRNYSYNDGNNYLGVRSIDFMIKDWYFKELEKNNFLRNVENLIANNPDQKNALTLKCRKAKEQSYSTSGGNITYGLININLDHDAIDTLASSVPIVQILNQITKIDSNASNKFANKDWVTCFTEYLKAQKEELQRRELPIGRIIVTGGASKMTFIPPIVRKVFSEVPENEIYLDADSSRTISKGLALVGPSNVKSLQFQRTVEDLNANVIPQIISNDLVELANTIAPIIENIVTDIILARVHDWRNGYIRTINQMTAAIQGDIPEEKLKKKLDSSQEYKEAVKIWTEKNLGRDIAQKLENICTTYNVTNFTVNDLNIMENVAINPDVNIQINPLDGVVDIAATIAGLIGGTIAIIILPTVVAFILTVIATISTTIAGLLFGVLSLIPGPGWFVIALVVAVALKKIIVDGVEGFRDEFNNKVKNFDIPVFVDPPLLPSIRPRETLTDDKIKSEIKKANIVDEVKKVINANKSEISDKIFDSIRDQVKQKTDDIKYCIESR